MRREAALLAHLGPCPPCLPQAIGQLGQVGICGEAGKVHMLSGVVGLLTQRLGRALVQEELPLSAADLTGLTHCLLQAIVFLEVS